MRCVALAVSGLGTETGAPTGVLWSPGCRLSRWWRPEIGGTLNRFPATGVSTRVSPESVLSPPTPPQTVAVGVFRLNPSVGTPVPECGYWQQGSVVNRRWLLVTTKETQASNGWKTGAVNWALAYNVNCCREDSKGI